MTAVVDDDYDLSRYNLTVCNASCPLEISSDHFQVTGVCSNEHVNCYIDLRGKHPRRSDPQLFTRFMLQGSALTFIITGMAPQPVVQLCITNTKEACGEVFHNSSAIQVCLELLTFNQTNDYIQTFKVTNSGYYCAVWMLINNTQSLNYTVNVTLQSYSTPALSHCQVKTQNQVKTQIFNLNVQNVANRKHNQLCIVVQVVGNHLYNSITLVSTVTSSVNRPTITFLICAVLSCLAIVAISIIIIIIR